MDTQWALAELRMFIALTQLEPPEPQVGVGMKRDHVPFGDRDTIVAAAQVVEKILDRVIPQWRTSIEDDGKRQWVQHREAAQRSVAEIERQAEIAERLGDNAPTISASGLHPWAWDSARSLWQSGHYREAVRAACVKVNAETQNKVGRRDVSETDLFKQVYSDDQPQPGKARLRPALDDGGRTAKSARRGVAAFAEGCFAAIRNPSSHESQDELSAQEGLEQLAALSVLARWVEGSSVATS